MSSSKTSKIYLGRYRLVYGYLIGLVCLLLAKSEVFVPGAGVALLGIAIRVWAAGCINKNSRLAMTGPYALTRNPLYLGSFVLGAGMVMTVRAWWLLPIYIAGFALFYVPTILKEQNDLIALFGDEYREYCRKVPIFIPWKPRVGEPGFSFKNVVHNKEHRYAIIYIIFVSVLAVVGSLRAV